MEMEFKNIGQIAEVIAGQSPPSDSYNEKSEGLPFYQGKTDFGELNPTPRKWCTNPTRIAQTNDVLMSVRAPVGPVNIANEEACIGRGIAAIRAKDAYDFNYIYFYLKNNQELISRYSTGSTFKSISKKDIEKINIPIPVYPEDQKRIAQVLSDCETLIGQRKESIALLDDLLRSTFLEMFGDPISNPKKYPEKKIKDLCLKIVDCPHSTPKYQDGITDFPCIRTSEIKDGYIDWTSMRYTDVGGYAKRVARLVPKEGDIVFAREGSVGDSAVIPKNTKLSLGQRVMLMRPDSSIVTPKFFWAMLRSDGIQHKIQKKTIGATVKRINIGELKEIKCLIPPIELQLKFFKLVARIELTKNLYKNHLTELENLYGRLSQDAFKGELDLKKVVLRDGYTTNELPLEKAAEPQQTYGTHVT